MKNKASKWKQNGTERNEDDEEEEGYECINQ